ncbi:hypothetical protein M0802_009392 [Mischocyttarus mexicanus]|nr:hypothetical protein M0802_009392 [Mischocyttarus mexicanus]
MPLPPPSPRRRSTLITILEAFVNKDIKDIEKNEEMGGCGGRLGLGWAWLGWEVDTEESNEFLPSLTKLVVKQEQQKGQETPQRRMRRLEGREKKTSTPTPLVGDAAAGAAAAAARDGGVGGGGASPPSGGGDAYSGGTAFDGVVGELMVVEVVKHYALICVAAEEK